MKKIRVKIEIEAEYDFPEELYEDTTEEYAILQEKATLEENPMEVFEWTDDVSMNIQAQIIEIPDEE